MKCKDRLFYLKNYVQNGGNYMQIVAMIIIYLFSFYQILKLRIVFQACQFRIHYLLCFFLYTEVVFSISCCITISPLSVIKLDYEKIRLFITSSIDGYIATPDGDLDWFIDYPNPERLDYGFQKFLSEIDSVILGGQAYRSLKYMDVVWPYKGKTTYIISRNLDERKNEDNIIYITDDVVNKVAAIKEDNGRDIALAGGSEITGLLLKANLVDEMVITTVPVLLGDGIPLFSQLFKTSEWSIIESTLCENGLLQAIYRKKDV